MQSVREELERVDRLEFFPIMMFAVVMGISGLAIVYQRGHELFGIPALLGDGFAAFDVALFGLISGLYLLKWARYPAEVLKEFAHPIRVNFFAATSISLLLLSIVLRAYATDAAWVLFVLGVGLHTLFTLHTISFWINHNFEITHSNPAWFIPIVGNVIVPVAGSGFAPNEFLFFYFSIGMLFWIVLFTVIFYRIIFHHQLAQKFIPTLFILIAPPAVGFLAYLKCGYPMDAFAQFLLNTGLFFLFLLLFMVRSFLKLKFFISWWAFTFPMAAITLAVMLAYHATHGAFYYYAGYVLMVLTTIVVGIVAFRTIQHMMRREVCVAEH